MMDDTPERIWVFPAYRDKYGGAPMQITSADFAYAAVQYVRADTLQNTSTATIGQLKNWLAYMEDGIVSVPMKEIRKSIKDYENDT
jgi:hypothetical protein